jgi:uncharacterized protein YndB with AHSA1/START domain
MKEGPIVIEAVYNAAIDDVWQAITDKNKMKEWYFDVSDFKPEPVFEFRFNGGNEDKVFVHLCKIIEAIPKRKLSYSWRFEGLTGNSLLTFELFEEPKSTRLKLTHDGLETFPPDPDLSKENFRQGWKQITGSNLKRFVETNS